MWTLSRCLVHAMPPHSTKIEHLPRDASAILRERYLAGTFSVVTQWHRGRAEMNNISQTTFSNVFSSMKMFKFRLKFKWSLFPTVQLTIFQHWFRQWLGAVQATSHYLNQWWLVYRRIYASLGLNELINVFIYAWQRMQIYKHSRKQTSQPAPKVVQLMLIRFCAWCRL